MPATSQEIHFQLEIPPLQGFSNIELSSCNEPGKGKITLKSIDFDQTIIATISLVDSILVHKVEINTGASQHTDDTKSGIILTHEGNSFLSFSCEKEKTSVDTLEKVMEIIEQRMSEEYSRESANIVFLSELRAQLEKLETKLVTDSKSNPV